MKFNDRGEALIPAVKISYGNGLESYFALDKKAGKAAKNLATQLTIVGRKASFVWLEPTRGPRVNSDWSNL